jgi:hypothetical protein
MATRNIAPEDRRPFSLVSEGLCALAEFVHGDAQIEITGALLPDGRAVFRAVVSPCRQSAWTDFWTTDVPAPLEVAMTRARARMTRLVDELGTSTRVGMLHRPDTSTS